jgi:hypothetical protein
MPELDGVVKIRFCRDKGWQYTVVAWRGLRCMPFTPTHVEAETPQNSLLGMHGKPHDGFPAGMVERKVGYDYDHIYVMPDGRRCDITVEVPCTKAQEDAFYAFLRKSIGEPYDWLAPWTFLFGGHHHSKFHSTCAAKIHMAFRESGIFRWPTSKPANEYEPADIMDVLSHLVEIPH